MLDRSYLFVPFSRSSLTQGGLPHLDTSVASTSIQSTFGALKPPYGHDLSAMRHMWLGNYNLERKKNVGPLKSYVEWHSREHFSVLL